MAFHQYPAKPWGEILPRAGEEARDLVGRLVTYQSSDRMSAAEVKKKFPVLDRIVQVSLVRVNLLICLQALDHPFFKD